MSAQHTPAPWYWADNAPGAPKNYRMIVDADGFTIAEPSPMGEADARLIAAAPDLLNALLRIQARADYGKDNPRKQTDVLFDILELSRDVIAKATGENT